MLSDFGHFKGIGHGSLGYLQHTPEREDECRQVIACLSSRRGRDGIPPLALAEIRFCQALLDYWYDDTLSPPMVDMLPGGYVGDMHDPMKHLWSPAAS